MSNVDKAKLNALILELEVGNGNLYKGVNLTRTQRKSANLLLAADGVCTKEHLYDVLYTKQKYKPDPKTLRELLCVIRQLEPLGIEIDTVFVIGYIIQIQK